MNTQLLLVVALFFFTANQLAYGDLSGEAKTRRQTCGALLVEDDSVEYDGCPCQAYPGQTTSQTKAVSSETTENTESSASTSGQCTCSTGSEATENSESSVTTESVTATTGVSGCSCPPGDIIYNCPLIKYLYGCSVNLTIEEYELWIEWIKEIKITILSNSSLTSDQKIVLISYSLQAFFEVNVEIQSKLYFIQLGSWGWVVDLVYVAYEIEIEITQTIVTLDVNGNCALFTALRNCASGNSEMETAVESLIASITVVLETSYWTYTQQQAQIYLLFQQFFSVHVSWQAQFNACSISGYGCLQYYIKSAFWYYQITTIEDVVGGSSSDCVLLQTIYACSQNTSYPLGVRSQILQLYNVLVAFWDNTTDITLRLQYFSEECYSEFELSIYLQLYLSQLSCGSWGSIYDLFFCSQVCTNCGCDNGPSNGPGTEEPSSSTVTEAATTEVTTEVTTEATTEVTTEQPADCNHRCSMININSDNTTYFLNAVGAARLTWSNSDRSSFTTYWNLMVKAIYGGGSQCSIVQAVITYCSEWNANNPTKQQLLFVVEIVEWKGTVGQFVGCGSTCNG